MKIKISGYGKLRSYLKTWLSEMNSVRKMWGARYRK